jgi:hypothetical protein
MWNAEQRRRGLSEHLQRLSAAARQVEAQPEQLTNGQKALLADLKLILRAVPRAIDETWQEFSAVQSAEERERSRRDLCSNFEELIQTLLREIVPVLTGGAASLVPVELEPVLQDEVQHAAPSKSYRPILYSTPEFNYSIVPVPSAAEVLDHAGATTGEATEAKELLSVSSPAIGKDSIALHAILVGHEIGHLRQFETGVAAGFAPPVPDAWKDADGNVAPDHEESFDKYVRLVSNWGEELAADIFSCLTLGPVALLALPEVVGIAAELDEDSDSHPAAGRRIRLMAEFLLARGFGAVEVAGEAINAYADQFANAPAEDINIDEPNLVEPATEAWTVLRGFVEELREDCIVELDANSVMGPDAWPAVLRARDLLRWGLPCGDTWSDEANASTPTPITVILNAAWLVKIQHLGDLASVVATSISTTEGIGEVSYVLDQLVTKSIEIANHLKET